MKIKDSKLAKAVLVSAGILTATMSQGCLNALLNEANDKMPYFLESAEHKQKKKIETHKKIMEIDSAYKRDQNSSEGYIIPKGQGWEAHDDEECIYYDQEGNADRCPNS